MYELFCPVHKSQNTLNAAHRLFHMSSTFILASGSEIRSELLTRAGVAHQVGPARIDEGMVRDSLLAEEARPRDVADTLAELKARKVSEKHPDVLVLGCDQVLDHGGVILSKAQSPEEAEEQLKSMRNRRHMLL